MTSVQNQPAPAHTGPVLPSVLDAMDAAGPQVCDDMTVEVALSVMASARTVRLRVCDNDGMCTALVTRAQLAVVRDGPGYSDRVQLRDILGERGTRAPAAGRTAYRRTSALVPAL
ncbi:CBS domain-containing protein [Streptomyces sp. DT224]|uniref:CBS domain-containing protein n=1 Tax=Streptomyces sp. DT224 TaxID=3393426 RepID=UPI003CEFB6B1